MYLILPNLQTRDKNDYEDDVSDLDDCNSEMMVTLKNVCNNTFAASVRRVVMRQITLTVCKS